MFHQTEEGIRPSIIDPHGPYIGDAAGKLRGLAAYAAAHDGVYDRIESLAEIDGKMIALDLRSASVCEVIAKVNDGAVEALYKKHGGNYSS